MGTLAYVWDRTADRVLMVHRNARPDDEHLGKFNGLGGKLEADEDIVAGVMRELHEEAAITPTAVELRGTISWPGFGRNGEDWFGFIFLVDRWTGLAPTHNDEGELHWVERERLLRACDPDPEQRASAELPMWEGDRWFLPLVFDADPTSFHGIMPYHGGAPVSWAVQRI